VGRRRRLQPLSLLRTALTELLEGAPPTHVQEPVHAAAAIVRERHGLDVPDIRMSKVGRKLYVEVVFLVECGHSDVDAEDAVRRAADGGSRWQDGRMMYLTGDPAADSLLAEDDLALLLGMLLDQQVTMESAFAGPAKIRDRIGTLDAATIAAMAPDSLVEVFRRSPSVHRFPRSMAARAQAVSAVVRDEWGGDAGAIWTRGDPDGPEILRRLTALPGFGEQKARIFLALLGKRRGLTATGWREASAPYGAEGTHLSVADVVDEASLARVREAKRAAKAAARKPARGAAT